jgi:phage tail-like protein
MNVLDLPQEVISRLNVLDLEKLKGFRFAVQIDSEPAGKQFVAGFNQVSGLTDESEIRTIREGGWSGVHEFPARVKASPLVLKRGMTFSRSLWNWRKEVSEWTKGQPGYTRSLSVILLDTVNAPVIGEVTFEAWRWDFFKAWPSKWDGPKLDSMKSDLAFETVTIRHSGMVEARGVLSGQAGEILSIFN